MTARTDSSTPPDRENGQEAYAPEAEARPGAFIQEEGKTMDPILHSGQLYDPKDRAFCFRDLRIPPACLKTAAAHPIRLLSEEERGAALKLAWKVFTEYESPDYAPEGTEEFRQTLENEAYLAGLRYYGAFDGERLIGLLAIRPGQRHICFFFVDGAYQRRGIGTRLFLRCREDFPGQRITLNSSPYGLPFYQALGFRETGGEQTVRGIRFTPMAYGEE